ncbi:MAG: hypothetical protein KF752_05910 [Pirellulaceae bacterium]|nr:hypothetical protein [Pirellulaceae bacterium]
MLKLKCMLLTATMAVSVITQGWAQELVRYNLFGQPGTQVSNSPEYVDSNATGLDLTRSAGLQFTTSGVNSMNSSNWSVGQYYSFGFSVNSGYEANLTNLQIGTRSSASGPKYLVLYCSNDNFTSPIATITHPPVVNFVNSDIDLSGLTGLTGQVEFRLRVDEDKRAADETPMSSGGTNRVTNFFAPSGDPPANVDTGGFRINGEIVPASSCNAQVVAAQVYHAGWTGIVGDAVDTVKSMVKEGAGEGPQVMSLVNLTNSAYGLNGVQFGIQNVANAGALSAADFTVQLSPQGPFNENANPPSGWTSGPAPTVSVTVGSPTTVLLTWANGAIANRWARITIKANTNTGLCQDCVYYVGHLLGETTGESAGYYTVSFGDITEIKNNVSLIVNSGNIYDIDKNGTVAFLDITTMRSNISAQLTNITVP